MRFKKRMKYVAMCLGAVMMAFAAVTAYAQGAVEVNTQGSLTMSYNINGTVLSGVKAHLYKVASMDAAASFTRTEAFQEYTAGDLNALTDAGTARSVTTSLVQYVTDHTVAETASVSSGTDGNAAFASLATGLYLVTSDSITSSSVTYTFQPALIALPRANNDTNSWDYNPTATPKYEKTTNGGGTSGGGGTGGGGGSSSRRVTTINDQGTPLGTTTIDDGDVPEGNTILDEPVPLGVLPKTGEDGTPVAALGFGGAVLFAFGFILTLCGRKKNENKV